MADDCKYKFLSEPDDALKCLICLEVADEPWQHVDCGRLFCKKCLFKYGKEKPCPNCRMDKPQYFPDNRSKRDIKALPVKCSNANKNCKWTGTVGTFEKHVTTCSFALLPCPNKCKDSRSKVKHFMRKNLDTHLTTTCPNRVFKCEYCGKDGTYAEITKVHDEVCPKKTVSCTNTGCSKTLQRQHMAQHIKSKCEFAMIACKYKSIGCETELKRKELEVHELDDTLHLRMAINTVAQLKEDTTQLSKAVKESHDIVLKQGESVKIRLADYEQKKQSKAQFNSLSFYTSQGYHMALTVYANGNIDGKGTHVSVYVDVVEGKHDAHLRWPFLGSITITLLNQLKDKSHYSRQLTLTSEENMIVGKNWGYPQFIPHSALGHDPIKSTQYLKDDTLYFTVSVKVEDDKPWLQYTPNNTLW